MLSQPARTQPQDALHVQVLCAYPDHHHERHAPVDETFDVCPNVPLVGNRAFNLHIPCLNVTANYEK